MIPSKVYSILVNLLPMIILFTIVTFLLRIVTLIYAKEKIIWYKEIINLAGTIYLFCLFWLVTTNDFGSYSNNFIPFKEIFRYKTTSALFYRNVIGNILLFIPFGYIVTNVINDSAKKYNFFVTTFIVLMTSLTIEVIQIFIGRSFDIDDIILNVIGGMFGYILFKLVHKFLNKIDSNIIKLIIFISFILICVLLLMVLYGVI